MSNALRDWLPSLTRLLLVAVVCRFHNAPQAQAAPPASIELIGSVAKADVSKVEAVLEIGGVLTLKEKSGIKSLPTSVVARFAYDEKLLDDTADARRSARNYRQAEAKYVVDKLTTEAKLDDARKLFLIRTTDAQPEMLCPLAPLTADELDLVQIPFNSLLVEQLLPSKEVAVGDAWTHTDRFIAGLLNLDAVSQTTVASVLTEIDDTSARIELKGVVQGAIDGVATEIEITGRYKFDRAQKRVTWLAVLMKEKRSIGHVEPGLEVQSRLQMVIAPTTEPEALNNDNLEEVVAGPTADALRIRYSSSDKLFAFDHDRRWHVMADRANVLSLRMVDRGELVAQCNVTSVVLPDATRRPTLAQFQADVRRSLDKHFGQFTQVTEAENSLGHTVFRAEATGEVEELAITWIYYLVQDAHGRQTVFAFTCEQPMLERMAGADEEIISTLQFAAPVNTAAQPTPASNLK
ncbi:MAG: hypothetical protein K8U03_18595 [Planctomycetia bacterium]|nr:hypothetical protein [Planctomycetia bacterium]